MTRKTRFSDVCGSMDELKRLAVEQPALLHEHAVDEALPLLEDALYMIGRMRSRLADYASFREALRELVVQLDDLTEVEEESAENGARQIRSWCAAEAAVDPSAVADIHAAAEQVRSVASHQEQVLRRAKDLALQVHQAFETVRHGRPWLLQEYEKETLAEQLRRRYQAWLPPQPAADIMIDWLCRDRLTVQEGTDEGGQPVVLFDDGGSIPMSQLRWNRDLKNFVPAGTNPGA